MPLPMPPWPSDPASLPARNRRTALLLIGHGSRVPEANGVLEEVATRHLDSWTPHICHHDDAVPTLGALKEEGLTIGLLSNTHWPRSFHPSPPSACSWQKRQSLAPNFFALPRKD